MMMSVDWVAVALGFASGAGAATVFFAGLGWGMRMALRATYPAGLLALSAALRILTLLGAGWLVNSYGGLWALAGYAAAFIAVRTVTLAVVRAGVAPHVAPKGVSGGFP